GRLIQIAVEDGRKVKNELVIALCGEHGGEYRTVRMCHALGMDYVSCSAYRVPIARLAAAQAKLEKDY
ncbi:MAG: putative PEP-binding protein, partial [bacterium]